VPVLIVKLKTRNVTTSVLLFVSLLVSTWTVRADVAAAVDAASRFRSEHELQILADFRSLLSIPNVSANPTDMAANAQWIARYLTDRQFAVEIFSAGRAPYLIAERLSPAATATVLIYAHFDGQPVDLAEWSDPPFTPTLRDGPVEAGGATVAWTNLETPLDPEWRLYARSAGDDKAPIIALAAALDALDAAGIAPSINLKLILDGEEEAGSPTLARILEQHADKLRADVMLFCDGPMHQSRRRQLVFGVRGSVTVELTAYGANRPLHSGHYGNWAPNPTDNLIRLLATLKDAEGRIRIPGYYDAVVAPTDAELAAIAAMPQIDDRLQAELNLARRQGGEERIERLMLDPAIVVKGFQAGGVGAQSANVIRPIASASLNLRLVPDQTPDLVVGLLGQHFAQQGAHVVTEEPSSETLRRYPDVLWLEAKGGYPGFRTELDGSAAIHLAGLLDEIDGVPTLMTPTMGGSLPIYLFEEALNMPVILLPIANHDNNQHGANENLRIQNLWSAIEVYAAIIAEYGR
jgi:acetylornithine deacetylase/succinyl-diaminopimelate desuccinylase-like protein